jgi:hypothetical protein
MVRTTLLQGECAYYKNGDYKKKASSVLYYDSDANIFQMYFDEKWLQFRPIQVTGLTVYSSMVTVDLPLQQVPIPVKRYHLGLYVKFSPSEDLIFVYDFSDEENAKGWKAAMEKYLPRQKASQDVLVLLKTRERVPLDEVAKALAKHGLPSTEDDARRMVESQIVSGSAQGVIDGDTFVSQTALQRETIRYDVVTKFEIDKNGAFVLSCPKCGATIPIEKKESTGKCGYCGSSYAVPRKILDMM